MSQIVDVSMNDLWLLGGAALIAGIIAAVIALISAKGFSQLVERVNYPLLCGSVLLFLVILCFVLTGWKGLAVLVASTALGLLAPWLKVSRAHAMGCLLIPTLTYYL
jgi:TctA family transporter